jgi:hypothetical protein
MVEGVEMERPTSLRDVPLTGVIELNNSASTADDGKDENNQCNHKQDMDIRAEYVEADESEQPQDQKNYKNGPQHSFRLLTVKAGTCDKLRVSGKKVAASCEYFMCCSVVRRLDAGCNPRRAWFLQS